MKYFEKKQDDALIRDAYLYAELENAREADGEENGANAERAWEMYREKVSGENRHRKNAVRIRAATAAAVCVILLVSIPPILAAQNTAFRSSSRHIVVSVEENSLRIGMNTEALCAADVPDAWSGGYFPVRIPDGFTLFSCDPHGDMAEYRNGAGAVLKFSECSPWSRKEISTENAETSYLTVCGESAIAVRYPDRCILSWAKEDRFFLLEYSGDLSEALCIAESTQAIIRK